MRGVLAVVVVLLAGCAGAPEGVEVDILDRTYAPDALSVPNGTSVRFVNVDDEEHTVTLVNASAPDIILAEARVPAGQSATQAFPDAGAFIVYCRYHGDPATGQRMAVTVS